MEFSPFKILEYLAFGNNRIEREKEDIANEVAALSSELIPWNRKDAELLSYGCINKKINRGDGAKGVFVSIYDEPMVSFSSKSFKSSKMKQMMMAMTANHKMLYIKTPKSTKCYFNDQQIGFMTDDFKFYNMKKRLAGRINSGGDDSYSSVIYKDAELGLINPLSFDAPFNKRVFDLINDKLSAEGEIILLCMTFYYLVEKLYR